MDIKKFEIIFLNEATTFLEVIEKTDLKAYHKILFNIGVAQYNSNPELLKKIDKEVWEFRTLYGNKQYRLLAFWDKVKGKDTFVIVTHGFIKKQSKVPKNEIEKVKAIKSLYLEQKKYEKE